tara:strand:- start:277 stop:471 length:195 start_codon:yes stop_codon:yes gene_type:complete
MNNSKLTSVKVIESLYNKFKISTVGTDMTLQKLTNRCVDLYIHNEEFRGLVEENENLKISGSKL